MQPSQIEAIYQNELTVDVILMQRFLRQGSGQVLLTKNFSHAKHRASSSRKKRGIQNDKKCNLNM